MFGYLLDAFLIDAVSLATESERRRNTNPRKIYPVDTGMIGAFDSSGRSNAGHALECVVHDELVRRGAEVGYVRTAQGFEVDFHVRFPDGASELIQICADIADATTRARELRALDDAAQEFPRATRRLLVLDRGYMPWVDQPGVAVQAAYEWSLMPAETGD
jgi:predicted AAA+ superfamily ATPase